MGGRLDHQDSVFLHQFHGPLFGFHNFPLTITGKRCLFAFMNVGTAKYGKMLAVVVYEAVIAKSIASMKLGSLLDDLIVRFGTG